MLSLGNFSCPTRLAWPLGAIADVRPSSRLQKSAISIAWMLAKAPAVAQRNLRDGPNCTFHLASVDVIPLPDASTDFGYSLRVLLHVLATQAAMMACAGKLKLGAPFLVYLYYAFDNRPLRFRVL